MKLTLHLTGMLLDCGSTYRKPSRTTGEHAWAWFSLKHRASILSELFRSLIWDGCRLLHLNNDVNKLWDSFISRAQTSPTTEQTWNHWVDCFLSREMINPPCSETFVKFCFCLFQYLIKVNEIKTRKGVDLLQNLIKYYHAQCKYVLCLRHAKHLKDEFLWTGRIKKTSLPKKQQQQQYKLCDGSVIEISLQLVFFLFALRLGNRHLSNRPDTVFVSQSAGQ